MAAKLSDAEVSVIKGLFVHYDGQFTNQDILNKFSVPTRTVNAGRISEIKNGHERYKDIPTAAKDKVDKFLSGEIKLHHLAGKLFPMPGVPQPQFVFNMIEYDPATLKVSTRESGQLEYKEIHESDSIPVYLKILASMANAGQEGGSIIFGISDNPPEITGVSPDLFGPSVQGLSMPEKWRALALECFEPFFGIDFSTEAVGDKFVASAQLTDVPSLPIICRRNKSAMGKGADKSLLKEAAIYYRYTDSTREIRHAELRLLIDGQIKAGIEARRGENAGS